MKKCLLVNFLCIFIVESTITIPKGSSSDRFHTETAKTPEEKSIRMNRKKMEIWMCIYDNKIQNQKKTTTSEYGL
jgi:hypothetical protein